MAVMGYRQRWVAEDAFISLRVVENILAGNGPVFNSGERVEAYTHPLWVATIAAWGALGLPTAEGTVILGIALSLVGLIAAMAAARRLTEHIAAASVGPPSTRCRPDSIDTFAVPLGALIFVAIPVVWDFITSGLETGLSFAWLGMSFWLLVRAGFVRDSTLRTRVTSAIVIGLGPLVRPDLAIFSLGFLVALAVCSDERSRLGWLRRGLLLVGAAGSLPLAYQIFRMGYFAALVPNTALAKEAGDARWSQGWVYLRDFTETYQLWLPLLIAAAFFGAAARQARTSHDRRALVVMAAPVVSALPHALYVVRIGGDFMHGRFLLPTLFGLLLPVMLVHIPLRRPSSSREVITSAALLVIAGWTVVTALWLRVPYQGSVSADGIADERGVYALLAGNPHPITIDDYMDMRLGWTREGRRWRDLASRNARVLVIDESAYPLDPRVDSETDVVILAWNIGLSGYAAGLDVHVTDRYGLSDPLASRLRLTKRGRPGHEKQLDPAWAIARFGMSEELNPLTRDVLAARHAISCGAVAELLDAVEEPLTAERFFDNALLSLSLRDLRIPSDPRAATAELCP